MVGPRSAGAQEQLWPARRGELAQEVRSIIREGGRRLASDGGVGDMEEMVAMVIWRVGTRGPLSL